MGEDHGLRIKGLGETLVSPRNGDAWLEIVCAGGEAELSLAAGDGADPWQGGIGGAA